MADQARALVAPEIRALRVLMATTALVAEQAPLVQAQALETQAPPHQPIGPIELDQTATQTVLVIQAAPVMAQEVVAPEVPRQTLGLTKLDQQAAPVLPEIPAVRGTQVLPVVRVQQVTPRCLVFLPLLME
jgi:hypothetical protein